MHHKLNSFSLIRKALVTLSLFSLFSILFFETTILTQLSTTEQMNSFGRKIKYVEPEYLLGYLNSILQVESYFSFLSQASLESPYLNCSSSLLI